jgi:hypothetical protein
MNSLNTIEHKNVCCVQTRTVGQEIIEQNFVQLVEPSSRQRHLSHSFSVQVSPTYNNSEIVSTTYC